MGVGGISIWQLLIFLVFVGVLFVVYRFLILMRQAAMKTWGSTSNSSHQQPNSNSQTLQPQNSPQVSVGIIIIYSVVTWLIVSALAKGYVELVMAPKFSGYSMNEAQPVMWSWASALMGIFMALRLKRWAELFWGGLFFVACLVPPAFYRELGMLASIAIGIGYFSWCYVKLEKDRLGARLRTASNSESNDTPPTQVNIIVPTKDAQHISRYPTQKKPSPKTSEGPRLDLYKLDDDELYRMIWNELENDSTDKAIWSRLYVKHEGNLEKIRVAYIEDRFKNLNKDRDDQSEIVEWIENFAGSSEGRAYSSADLNRLQVELLQDTGDPELWKECVHWAKRTGKNVEDHYRKVRLQEINKKGNRVTWFRNS